MATTIPLRILCLHDAHSNVPLLKEQIGTFGEKLYREHGIDLVYVNGPIVASPQNDDLQPREQQEGRVWWEEIDHTQEVVTDPNDISGIAEFGENGDSEDATSCDPATKRAEDVIDCASKIHYRGLDASLMLLKQIWTSTPFFGILGVGQGAAVASLLMSLLDTENLALEKQEEENLVTMPTSRRQQVLPQLAIFVLGESLVPVDEPILDTTNLPILHLVNAEFSAKEKRLCKQLPGKVEHRKEVSANSSRNSSQSTRSSAFDRHDFNIMGRFLVEQKKRLFGFAPPSNTNTNRHSISTAQEVVALQTALYLVEQQAADAIAESISLRPPAALMAVIRPQQVAGWNGTKRRPFGAEGGGAPCPSEFLLNRQQRVNQSSEPGPSREHPSNIKTERGSGESITFAN